jgi:hypothetical protein
MAVMTTDTKDFLISWLIENIHAESYEPDGDRTRSRETAGWCREAAEQVGISGDQLDVAARDLIGGGDYLTDFIASVLKRATDAEISRLGEKDG